MTFLTVRHLTKRRGKIIAVYHLDLEVKKGEFVTLLGPSGCGKTTTLRCIAGLEEPDEGEIVIDGVEVTSIEKGIFVPPEKRDIGMVFQSYAIWPHMTVEENVSYGLKARKVPIEEIRRRTNDVLELVGLDKVKDRQATDLSGGQQQRVAVARAVVYNPRLLLFDEPLSNLDARLRERMRVELKNLQKKTCITSIFVTHDQIEAMSLSDRILIMREGRIIQAGDPRTVYAKPANEFVIDFLGATNFIKGFVSTPEAGGLMVQTTEGPESTIYVRTIEHFDHGDSVLIAFRPHSARLYREPQARTNFVTGRVVSSAFLGSWTEYSIEIAGDKILKIQSDEENEGFQVGEKVFVFINPEKSTLLRLQ